MGAASAVVINAQEGGGVLGELGKQGRMGVANACIEPVLLAATR